MTLADAAKITNDMVVRGVIQVIIKESGVLRHLPFMNLTGTALTWGREKNASTVQWHAVDDTWVENVGTIDPATAKLAILGGDADVDNFLQQTYSDPNDITAVVLEEKAKTTAYAYNDAFFNGDSGVTANQFDGLKKQAGTPAVAYTGLTASVRAWSEGANGATLTLDHMDRVIDALKGGRPNVLFTSKRTRRKLANLRRASGSLLETWQDMSGQHQWMYDGIPLEVDDNISDAETQGTNTDCSSIYAVRFGYKTGVMGLQNRTLQVIPVGDLETKDARRHRIKWYCGLVIFAPYSYVRLAGVRD